MRISNQEAAAKHACSRRSRYSTSAAGNMTWCAKRVSLVAKVPCDARAYELVAARCQSQPLTVWQARLDLVQQDSLLRPQGEQATKQLASTISHQLVGYGWSDPVGAQQAVSDRHESFRCGPTACKSNLKLSSLSDELLSCNWIILATNHSTSWCDIVPAGWSVASSLCGRRRLSCCTTSNLSCHTVREGSS